MEQYHIVYLIGLGGIGMSALARYFNSNGLSVYGYDRTPSDLINELEVEGMKCVFEDSIDAIPSLVKKDKSKVLVVYTPAIPKTNTILNYFISEGYDLKKRSEVLGMISQNHFTIAVAGTHGKTTTTSIIAYLMREANRNFTAFLGGVSTDFQSNYLRHHGNGKEVIIVEADEYDRSFLRLFPNIAIVTSVDPDHLDIYGDEEEMKNGYRLFVKNIHSQGQLILNEKMSPSDFSSEAETLSYGLNRGQFFASQISIDDGFFIFDLYAKNSIYKSLRLGVPGFHNIENAVASLAVMHFIGEDIESLRNPLSKFKGVKRRFEFHIRSNDLVLVDDYAHHPAEISVFLDSLRELYPNRSITILFQPHLFSRTRDFANQFGESLSKADKVLLLDIYPAREEPMEGVSSSLIKDSITGNKGVIVSKDHVLNEYVPQRGEVFATVGAGDIDRLVKPLTEKWRNYEMA